MTGAVTFDMVFGIGTILSAIVGVWLRIEYRIQQDARPLASQIAALQAEIRLLDKLLSEHKLYAAEHYARSDNLQQMREEILGRLDQITGRLDKAFAPQVTHRPRGGA
ncbi:hypothetical protein [Ancylobacter sp.]|uniref:hypothetical protein n=1 Tax=Ancylobacter sp. TaxID=1872567 RepID=UPI003C797556